MTKVKILDLFAGGGGFSAGFSNSRNSNLEFMLHRALELNDEACLTLENRYGANRVIKGDITEKSVKERILNECKGVDVIIGGPPCQTFSLAGPARSGSSEMREQLKNDPRNTLYKHFLELVEKLKPPFVVFENVEGMVSKKVESDLSQNQEKVIDLVCDELEALGYHTKVEGQHKRYQVLNSADYGAPQVRKRIIIIANRFNIDNPIPIQSHINDYRTIGDAIGHLPVRLPIINTSRMEKLKNLDILKKYYLISLKVFMERMKDLIFNPQSEQQGIKELYNHLNDYYENIKSRKNYKINALLNFIKLYNLLVDKLEINRFDENTLNISHQSREHNFRDIVIFSLMKQGSNSARFMNPINEDYDMVLDELYPYARSKHKDTYVKHSWDRPSNTILAHMEKDGLKFIHPEQPRTFTPYEAALLQSFPIDYSFCGGRNAQFRQIGNAVPPKMAEAIGNAILKTMSDNRNIIRPDMLEVN